MKKRFLRDKGSKTCGSCGHKTSLWNEGMDDTCDVCLEAGGIFNSYADGVIETEEKAKADFIAYANHEWPTLTEKRLEDCWDS